MDPHARQEGGDHYRTMTIQPWTVMEAWMSPEAFAGYLRGNIIKYLARYDRKAGLEDLLKAKHYLDKLIDYIGNPESTTHGVGDRAGAGRAGAQAGHGRVPERGLGAAQGDRGQAGGGG